MLGEECNGGPFERHSRAAKLDCRDAQLCVSTVLGKRWYCQMKGTSSCEGTKGVPLGRPYDVHAKVVYHFERRATGRLSRALYGGRPYLKYDPRLGVKDFLFTCKASPYAFAKRKLFNIEILPRGCGGTAIIVHPACS